MKTKYFTILFTIICLSCSQTKYIVSSDKNAETDVLYRIKHIEKYELFDIIYAKKDGCLFKIISLNDTIRPTLKPIEVKKKYQLNLIRIYPNSVIKKTIDGAIDSCFMSIEKKCNYNLYCATNLNGLFLSENAKNDTAVMNRFSIVTIFCDACKNKNVLIRLYLK
jgi:hypothetical protein